MNKSRKRRYVYDGTPISLVTIKELLPLAQRLAHRLCNVVETKDDALEPIVFEQTFFADRELMSRRPKDVAIQDTHVIYLDCPRYPTINDGLVNTEQTLDALEATGILGITHIILYLPYARQDKRKPGEPLSFRLVAQRLNGFEKLTRIITIEMHTEQHQNLFRSGIKLNHVRGHRILAEYLSADYGALGDECVVVSPDAGGVERASDFRQKLFPNNDLVVGSFSKRRPRDNEARIGLYAGPDVNGKDVLLYDDIIDTAGTLCGAADKLIEAGAKKVTAVAAHALLNRNAIDELKKRNILVVATESVPKDPKWLAENASWFKCVSLDEVLANVLLARGESATKFYL